MVGQVAGVVGQVVAADTFAPDMPSPGVWPRTVVGAVAGWSRRLCRFALWGCELQGQRSYKHVLGKAMTNQFGRLCQPGERVETTRARS